MPKIYEYFGLIFLIYSNEHEPVHVHVKYGGYESIIEIIRNAHGQVIEVRKRKGTKGNELPSKELNTALKFINVKAEEIVVIWKLIMKNKFNQKPIKITRKIV